MVLKKVSFLLVIGWLGLIHLPGQGCSAQTPKRPELSSFTAEFTVIGAGQEIHVKYYASVEEKKQLQVVSLGSADSGVTAYTWEIVHNKNETIEYNNIKPMDYCVGDESDYDPAFADLWYWLKKATYNGTKMFNGQKVDAWAYENKKEMTYFEVGVLATNPNEPMYYFSTEAIGVIVFNKYDGSPPPASVFDVPTNYCKLESMGEPRESKMYSQTLRYRNVFKSKLH